MYCNKCNSSLKEDDHICPNCGFDNDATIDLSQVVRKLSKKEEKKSKMIVITILLLILAIGIVIIYLINGAKEEDTIPVTTIPTTTSSAIKQLEKLTFNDISIEYSKDLFTNKDNILILNNNNKINIEFKIISAEEYSDEINGNECLDYKLNELLVKTFAGNDYYSYIFMLNDKYYDITINYINDPKIYTEAIQLEINQVLNTVKQK